MNSSEMLKEWIVDSAEIIDANYGLNTATEFGNKIMEESIRVAAVGPT